jgi:DNA-binding NarL/FixJ family response regulator
MSGSGVQSHRGDVVVVDDDAAFRAHLAGVLGRAGYATFCVATAEEAQTAIAEQPPDVVLTDVQLSGVSGYDLCRQLKEEYGDEISVMIVSGDRTEPFDRAAGILLGADDYMIKPVDPSELVARVWRLVERANNHNGPRGNTNGKLDALSGREREVLDLLAEGSDQDEIAKELFISPKTVATHIQRVLTKLGVHSRTQAVALALRQDRDVTGHRLGVKVAE